MGKPVSLGRPLPDGRIECVACARYCKLKEGQVGLCGIRGVHDGKLWLYVYGKVITGHVDPIEKKPVIHYRPGSKVFSIATTGCNWLCEYCLSDDVTVSTDQGMLTTADLWRRGTGARAIEGGEVADLADVRARTHRGRLMPIRQIFRHFYSGDLREIRPYYLPALRCTPDHRVFAAVGGGKRVTKVRARDLRIGDYIAVPKMQPGGERDAVDTWAVLSALPPPPYKRRVRLVEEEGIVRFGFGRARGVPRHMALTPEFARLLGYYAAEGSFSRAPDRPNSCTSWFSFGSEETERQAEVARLIERVCGMRPRKVRQKNRTALVVNNTPFALLLRELCGKGARNKRVPAPVLSSNDPAVVRAFLTGYLNGDGYVTESRIGTILGSGSVSEELTRGVLELFLRAGTVPRYYVGRNPPTHRIEGRTVSRAHDHMARVLVKSVTMRPEEVEWVPLPARVVETANAFLLPIRDIDTTPYAGYVYNLEVAGDHSYVAEFVAVANCQNYDISQRRKVEGIDVEPIDVVRMTLDHGCQGLAYTYNQPTIFIEFARDIGMEARKHGLFNVFVSNGYDTPDAVRLMGDFLDCITVDFKGSGETGFVRKYIHIPNADPIFETIKELRDTTKTHIEITDLVVPEVGDDLDAARKLARFVYDELGPDTPIHFLRFHPDYKMMDLPWTPVETLERHCEVAKEAGLKYVYIGNVPGHPLEHTYCPGCGAVAIRRHGFDIAGWNLDRHNRCKGCGYQLPIVGQLERTVREDRFYGVLWHP
jgi:pyruvate formate lyase activating enzyme